MLKWVEVVLFVPTKAPRTQRFCGKLACRQTGLQKPKVFLANALRRRERISYMLASVFDSRLVASIVFLAKTAWQAAWRAACQIRLTKH